MSEGRPTLDRPNHHVHFPDLLVIVNPKNVQATTLLFTGRARRVAISRGCATCLFITPHLRAYALSEEATCLPEWLNKHSDWFVGTYRPPKSPPFISRDLLPLLTPWIDRITADIHQHLRDLNP